MKSLVKAVALLCVAAVVAGWCYASLEAKKSYTVETRVFREVVRPGDTFNDIIGHYYDQEVNEVWDEFQTHAKQDNAKLFANGRFLQPGDVIVIKAKVRVVKND